MPGLLGDRPPARPRRHRHPRRLRRAGHRGQDRRRRLRPGARDPVPRPVPRPAGDGHRRAPGTWPASRGPTPGSSTPSRPHLVIDLMDEQHKVVDMGGTMRLGSYVASSSRARRWPRPTATTVVSERHRHRYEVNPRYRARLEEAGLACSGVSRRRPAGGVRRAPRPPVLGRDPGPPGVQEPAGPPPPAVPGAARCGLARAEGRLPRLIDHRRRRRCRLLSTGSGDPRRRGPARGVGDLARPGPTSSPPTGRRSPVTSYAIPVRSPWCR